MPTTAQKDKFLQMGMNYPAASYGVSKASIRNRPFVTSLGELTPNEIKQKIALLLHPEDALQDNTNMLIEMARKLTEEDINIKNKKWLNSNLTCGTNISGRSVEITMKRSLTIFSQVFLICTLFTNAWGLTNHERCVEAYFIDKDFTNAYHFCKEDEDSNAQYIIGEMYYNGFGVKEDHAEAAIWFRKAAEQGNPEAQFVLGEMYYNGLGVKEDHAEAIIWFRKAAKHGHIRAKLLRDKMLDKDKSK